MKQFIKKIPLVGKLVILIKSFFSQNKFKTSKKYWINRYKTGGNSGSGSYNNLAEFKGNIINDFVQENNIETVIEIGCGDGNQLLYFNFPHYIGFDISKTAIKMCKAKFRIDKTKQFYKLAKLRQQKADLVLSLDVIFHLIEPEIFEKHLYQLFNSSLLYVIIYSWDFEDDGSFEIHVKPRKFTNWIKSNINNFELIEKIPNKYPAENEENKTTSFADMFIYKRI